MVKYFWDTYALVLLLNGDEKVLQYAEAKGITTTLNVAELCAYLLRNGIECRKTAEKIMETFVVVEAIPFQLTVEASCLRHKMRAKGRKWSYIDALGYLIARNLKARFLTGDKEFRGVAGVEFVGKK